MPAAAACKLDMLLALGSSSAAPLQAGAGTSSTAAAQRHGSHTSFLAPCPLLRAGLGVKLVVVIGARPQINAAMREQGVEPRYEHGYRVTDADSMQARAAGWTGYSAALHGALYALAEGSTVPAAWRLRCLRCLLPRLLMEGAGAAAPLGGSRLGCRQAAWLDWPPCRRPYVRRGMPEWRSSHGCQRRGGRAAAVGAGTA